LTAHRGRPLSAPPDPGSGAPFTLPAVRGLHPPSLAAGQYSGYSSPSSPVAGGLLPMAPVYRISPSATSRRSAESRSAA